MSSPIGDDQLQRLVGLVTTLTAPEPPKVSKHLKQSLNLFLDIAEDELKITQEAATPASKAGTAGAPRKALAFAGDKWHADVKAQMAVLEKTSKLKEADLDQHTLNSLKKLPYEVALVCLGKIANNPSAILNMNAFIVMNCTHLRNQ